MTATAALKRFDTEQELTDYADQLNGKGTGWEPAWPVFGIVANLS